MNIDITNSVYIWYTNVNMWLQKWSYCKETFCTLTVVFQILSPCCSTCCHHIFLSFILWFNNTFTEVFDHLHVHTPGTNKKYIKHLHHKMGSNISKHVFKIIIQAHWIDGQRCNKYETSTRRFPTFKNIEDKHI